MGVIPASHRDILEGKGFAHVATLGPDGAPQSNPVGFEWDGDTLRFSQTKTRQKYRNLQRNPRIAVSILDSETPTGTSNYAAWFRRSSTTRTTPSSTPWPRSTSTRTRIRGTSPATNGSSWW